MAEALALTGRALLILLAVFLALLAVVLWFDVPKKEPPDASAKLLSTILPASLDSIQAIETEGLQAPMRIERGGTSTWRIVLPIGAEADPREVKSFYEGLIAVPIERVVEEKGADLAPFGLRPRAGRIRVFAASRAEAYEIEVGRASPVGEGRYATDGTGRVLLLGSAINGCLERSAAAIRERRLLPVEASAVRRLTVTSAGGSLVLERVGSGWKLTQPIDDLADANAADALVRAAVGLTAAEFPPDAEPAPGAGDTGLTVTVDAEGAAAPLQARIGSEAAAGRQWADRAGGGFRCRVDDTAVTSLRRTPEELRERRVMLAEPSEIREIVIRGGDSTGLTARREAPDAPWSAQEGGGAFARVEGRKLDDFLDRLRWLRADSLEPAAPGATAKRSIAINGSAGELGRIEILDDPPPNAAEKSARARLRSTWRPGLVLSVPVEGLGTVPARAADLAGGSQPKDKAPGTP